MSDIQVFESRSLRLGDLAIARVLPTRGRRLVGPWCFLDRFGPLSFTDAIPMDVAPHPHIGLQTVTWLLEGEVAHDDSLRYEAVARPGTVNVMTAGAGIAHAERTPRQNSGRLSGVQLWLALPDAHRHAAPAFQHVETVPTLGEPGGIVQLFAGGMGRALSPARHYSELIGAEVRVHAGQALALPLRSDFEHAVLVLSGDCRLNGRPVSVGPLYYMQPGPTEASFDSDGGARVLLLGGPPFPEAIVMWWNFVARTPEEIRTARDDWEARRRFGDVPGYPGPRLAAPELAKLAQPNPVS